jgi:hypothetical protein
MGQRGPGCIDLAANPGNLTKYIVNGHKQETKNEHSASHNG